MDTTVSMSRIFCLTALLFVSLAPLRVFGQAQTQEEVTGFVTVTIAVVNSDREDHIAFIKYFDEEGEILLNTSEEHLISISKSERFSTGSIRKSIPMYKNAYMFEVTVAHCENMHENQFLTSDLTEEQQEVTFVFQGTIEDMIKVEFEGIVQNKPCKFRIQGENTSKDFFAHYSNVQKALPGEARLKDVKVEISETTLFPYKITGTERDEEKNIIKITVALDE